MAEETAVKAAAFGSKEQMHVWEEEAREEHDEAAASLLYWFLEQGEVGTWVRYHAEKKTLVHADGSACTLPGDVGSGGISTWRPWNKTLCTEHSPYFRWFWAGRTNACLNLVDKHLFEGRGHDVAFTSCPEPDSGELKGSLPPSTSISRRNLAVAVALAAKRLVEEGGLEMSDRALFMMPTGISQMVYLLAAMRFGLLYVCTTVDQPDAALEYRMSDFKPNSIITHNGAVIHGGKLINCFERAQNLACGPCRVIAVDPITTLHVHDWAAGLGDQELSQKLATLSPVAALPSDHGLFVSYTSGSTGKPKGMVHTHGGYVDGIARTMEAVFESLLG
jgi:acyl-coenzyme A synthetase/AMP-(fatty) acid ligase